MAEQLIRETPEQESVRKDQARVRIEMGAASSKLNVPQPQAEYGDPFIFRFQRYKNTSFQGLWRLEILNRHGKVEETITDADALPNILEAIGNIFANKGY